MTTDLIHVRARCLAALRAADKNYFSGSLAFVRSQGICAGTAENSISQIQPARRAFSDYFAAIMERVRIDAQQQNPMLSSLTL